METDARVRGATNLFSAAASRISESLTAWVDGDFDRAAASAPTAVELIAKATLWQVHPTLLVPLDTKQEAALVALATEPSLDSPSLRTIGLRVALGRLTRVYGDLPVPGKRQDRLIDCRNGSLHVGTLPRTGENSAEVLTRQVLADSLTLCNFLLGHLGNEMQDLYGDKRALVDGLLKEQGSEVEHRVARLLAQAEEKVARWRTHVDDEAIWETSAEELEAAAPDAYSPELFGHEMGGIEQECPACGFKGRLLGRVDVEGDVDFDYSDGESVPFGYWRITFYPRAFGCNVCKLTLHDAAELVAGYVPATEREVKEADLGEDFSASEWAEALYGLRD